MNFYKDKIYFLYKYAKLSVSLCKYITMEKKELLIIGTTFIIVFIIVFFVLKFYIKKLHEIKKHNLNFNDNEIKVPIIASFVGIKSLSFLALGYNNFNPQLIFFQDKIKYRVFFNKTKKYSNIELVDINIAPGTKNLNFKFKDSKFTFIANLYDETNLKSVLNFLKKKNCILSPKAEEFLMK